MLVLRALGLGDLLAAVPALRAVRRGLPDWELVLATPAALAPLTRLAGLDATVLPAAGLGPLGWAGPAPEVAVNLHGSGPESHALLRALRPGRLVAYACPALGEPGPRWDEEEHEVDRWCRLARSAGWAADPGALGLEVPDRHPPVSGAVVVHPGAAYASRRWPASRFADVADVLRRRGYEVVVTGTAGERPLAGHVASAARLPPSAVLAGRTDVLDLAALVAASRLVVCGDTGVGHLATAFGTPSVLLFGPTPPARWGPRSGPHTVLWKGTGAGDAMGARTDPALDLVRVQEVVAAATDRLSARTHSLRG